MPDFRLNYGRSLSRKAKIITINLSKNDLNLNTDLFWKPFMKLQVDPGYTAIMLAEQFGHFEACKCTNHIKQAVVIQGAW